MQWFRFYSEALDDPKVQRLPGDLFKAWVNLLCLANEQDERGTLPSLDDITFRLRLDYQKCEDALLGLKRAGLLDLDPETDLYVIHAWDKRQYKSDLDATATDRKKRQRERERYVTRDVTRDISVTSRPMSRNVTRTDTDTDTEAEKIQKQTKEEAREEPAAPAAAPPKRVRELNPAPKTTTTERETRIPDDFGITPAMRDWAAERVPGLDIDYQLEEFCTYWRSVKTKRLDWVQTWQNGMIKAYQRMPPRAVRAAHTNPTMSGPMADQRVASWKSKVRA